MATLTDYLTTIANAIRSKKGTTDKINAQNFASEIESIEGGGGGATLNCGWEQGTPVPADATTTIQNIYLNTQLTQKDFGDKAFSVMFCFTDEIAITCGVNAETGEKFIAKVDVNTNETTLFYAYIDGVAEIEQYGFSGWNPDFNGIIEVNDTNFATAVEYGFVSAEDNLKYSYIASTENNFIKITAELNGEYTPKTINETINVVENGTTTLSYSSDFNTNKEILDKVDIVFNVDIPNPAQTLVDKRDLYYLFYNGDKFNLGNLREFFSMVDTSNATNANSMFYNCWYVETIPLFDTSNVTDMGFMFYGCGFLKTIPQFNTSNVTNMESMFEGCHSLTTTPLLDTSKVTNMHRMFRSCNFLTSISALDTSNVTDIDYMFSNCSRITEIPLFDTSKITSMISVFWGCSELTTIPAFDVSNVTLMESTFYDCTKLKSILMTGMKVSFGISSSTQFGASDLVVILNNLATVTSTTRLTMGSTNLAKLTDEEKAIATNKGWTLS